MLVEKQLPFRRRMLTADEPPAAAVGIWWGGWAHLPVLVDDTFSIADPMVIAGYLQDSYLRPSLLPSGACVGAPEVRMAMSQPMPTCGSPVERWAAHRKGPLTDLEDEVREAFLRRVLRQVIAVYSLEPRCRWPISAGSRCGKGCAGGRSRPAGVRESWPVGARE